VETALYVRTKIFGPTSPPRTLVVGKPRTLFRAPAQRVLGVFTKTVVSVKLIKLAQAFGFTQEKLGHITDFLFVSKVYYMVPLFAKMSNVILVAPSMSSKYALPFAVTEPERLAGLVLVGPVGTGLVPRRKLELLQVTHF